MKGIIALLIVMFSAPFCAADTLRLAVTTSFHNSGLSDLLLPQIKADTGIDVQLLIVGTGQALRLGQAGDVDAVLVHARKSEDAFVAAGHGTHRRPIMYNDFVIVGPADDPAGIAGTAQTAGQALEMIAAAKVPFVSRGDNSGTHKAELSLWEIAGLDPATFDPWYKKVGAAMGASLNTGAGLNAYVLTDRASWLNFGNKGDLTVVFEGDPALHNQYSFIPVNPERHPHVKGAATAKVEQWLTSKTAAGLINGLTIQGQHLFTFNAKF